MGKMKTSFIAFIVIFSFCLSLNLSFTDRSTAQESSNQRTKADKIFNQGLELYQRSQYREALQKWEQALQIYREIKDRNSEAKFLLSQPKNELLR